MSDSAAGAPLGASSAGAGGALKKARKPKGAKKVSSHPSYQVMIKKAIESLKERGGSSRQAIQKYIQANYRTCNDKVSQAHLKLALKRGADSGFLKRVKGAGALGSFRLADKAKGDDKPKQGKAKKRSAGAKKAGRPKTAKLKPAKAKKSAEKKASKPKVKKPKTPKKSGAAKVKKPGKAKKAPAKK